MQRSVTPLPGCASVATHGRLLQSDGYRHEMCPPETSIAESVFKDFTIVAEVVAIVCYEQVYGNTIRYGTMAGPIPESYSDTLADWFLYRWRDRVQPTL
jgi:hypothetical protein